MPLVLALNNSENRLPEASVSAIKESTRMKISAYFQVCVRVIWRVVNIGENSAMLLYKTSVQSTKILAT